MFKKILIFLVMFIFITLIGFLTAITAEALYKFNIIAGIAFVGVAALGLSVIIYKLVK